MNGKKARRVRAFLTAASGVELLGADELARLANDDLAAGDLRRVGEARLELLPAHPVGRNAGRLVGLRRRVEEADGAHDAVAGIDEVVAAEARQLAQAGNERLVDLLDELARAGLVGRLVASNRAIHVI